MVAQLYVLVITSRQEYSFQTLTLLYGRTGRPKERAVTNIEKHRVFVNKPFSLLFDSRRRFYKNLSVYIVPKANFQVSKILFDQTAEINFICLLYYVFTDSQSGVVINI